MSKNRDYQSVKLEAAEHAKLIYLKKKHKLSSLSEVVRLFTNDEQGKR